MGGGGARGPGGAHRARVRPRRGVGALGWLGISGLAAIVMQVIPPRSPHNGNLPLHAHGARRHARGRGHQLHILSPGRLTSQTDYLHHVGILLRTRSSSRPTQTATLQGMLNAQFETYIYWY